MNPPTKRPTQSIAYAKRVKRNVELMKTLLGVSRLSAAQRKSAHFLTELPEARQSR